MKKLFLLFVCTFMCIGANAQNKGFDSKSSFGISVNYSYNHRIGWDRDNFSGYGVQLVVKHVMLDLAYFPGKFQSGRQHTEIRYNAWLGYSFNLIPILNVYPLLGLYYDKYNYDQLEFSFGAGAQLHLFDGVYANARVTRNDVGGGLGYYF